MYLTVAAEQLAMACCRSAVNVASCSICICCFVAPSRDSLFPFPCRAPTTQFADPEDACSELNPPTVSGKAPWVALIARSQQREGCTFDIKVWAGLARCAVAGGLWLVGRQSIASSSVRAWDVAG